MRDSRYTITAPRFRCNERGHINRYPHAVVQAIRNEIGPDYMGIRDAIFEPVLGDSVVSAKRATEMIAKYFRREFSYDFVQYSAAEDTTGIRGKDRIFLWHERYIEDPSDDRDREAVGVICFRWRDWIDAPHGLSLAWVWLHPYLRHKGFLSAHWETFRRAYGDFRVEPPLSRTMKHFLERRGECPKCGRRCVCGDEK